MPKRPKTPKSQQAKIPLVERLDRGRDVETLRDLIFPPVDPSAFGTPDIAIRSKGDVFPLFDQRTHVVFASGDVNAIPPENDDRRFFAIDTKLGGHVGFMMEDSKTDAERGTSAHSVMDQVMAAAQAHWGPGVELEVYEMDGHAGYGIRPRHNYVQDQVGAPGSKDPETAKIIAMVQETMTEFAEKHGHYPTIRQIYYELVAADKWINSEENYRYLADIITKARTTQRAFDRSEPSMRYNPPDERLTPFDLRGTVASSGDRRTAEFGGGRNAGKTARMRETIAGTVTGRFAGGGPNAPRMYPYQHDMLERIMSNTPYFVDIDSDYLGFKDRYVKRDDSPRYTGKMSDYLHQYMFKRGDYTPNHIDDVFDRPMRRLRLKSEAKVREYCRSDVLIFADYASVEMRILFTLLDGYPTVPVSHRLKAPYGRAPGSSDWGIHISLIYTPRDETEPPWPDQHWADMIAGVSISFGCAPVYARNVSACMFGSGRYDCALTLSKHALRNLEQSMDGLDVRVVINCADRQGWINYAPDSDRDIR